MWRSLGLVAASLAILWSPSLALADQDCKRSDVAAILRDFFPAYNQGRFRELDALFARGERFRSYDVHPLERTGEKASRRKTLVPYFRERHDLGDNLDLDPATFRVGRYNNGNRGFGFSLELERTSDELAPFATGHFIVKGSVDCDGVYFWNMTWNGP